MCPSTVPCTSVGVVSSATVGSTTAGFINGAQSTSRFSQPAGVVTDGAGRAYISDTANNAIRVLAADGTVTTLAGGGFKSLGTSSGYADGAGVAVVASVRVVGGRAQQRGAEAGR